MAFIRSLSRNSLEARIREIEEAALSGYFTLLASFLGEDKEALMFRTFVETPVLLPPDADFTQHPSSIPASKPCVDAMPIFKFKKQSGHFDAADCAICMEAFEPGGEVREMPCKHIYHSSCILTWLARHRSCPICRREMQESSPNVAQGSSEDIGMVLGRFGSGIHMRSPTLWRFGGNHLDNDVHTSGTDGRKCISGYDLSESRHFASSNLSAGGHDSGRTTESTPVCSMNFNTQQNVVPPHGEVPRFGSNLARGENCGWSNRLGTGFLDMVDHQLGCLVRPADIPILASAMSYVATNGRF